MKHSTNYQKTIRAIVKRTGRIDDTTRQELARTAGKICDLLSAIPKRHN